jgi:hypothetical protein
MQAKADEKEAVERRRALEDELIKQLKVDEQSEGTSIFEYGEFQIKVVGRMNRKIDADQLQDIAAENGLSDHLSNLFNWKPSINMKLWKAADESITRPLLGAITTKAGRPSVSISIMEK